MQILFTAWFLTSLILTNSYKGLIIAYLSVPWTPEQDLSYFNEMKDFKFFSPVPYTRDNQYWNSFRECEYYNCSELLYAYSLFGSYIMFNMHYYILKRNDIMMKLFFGKIFAFSRNESNRVARKLINDAKMVVVGYNEEIDEILVEMRSTFKGHFFRGKENLWSHNKNWYFYKISYSQPRAELVQLMSSGIYQFWKYWLRDRNYIESQLKTESTAPPEPLSLSSNVAFVFIILIIGLGISILGFLFEVGLYKFIDSDIYSKFKTTRSNIIDWVSSCGRAIMFELICRCRRVRYIFQQSFLFIKSCNPHRRCKQALLGNKLQPYTFGQ